MTEDRDAFVPWLLWNYRKQDYSARELVVVDSSRGGPRGLEAVDGTVVRCAPGTSVAQKRNLAIDAARGELITWFDDDDWQHPRKLSILAATLDGEAALAGATRSWFVDLHRARARPYSGRGVIFNSVGVRRDGLRGIRFDEGRARAADTAWIAGLRRQAPPRVVPELLSWWLCHAGNLSNPARRYAFPHRLVAVRDDVGSSDWGDTDHELARLRDRLAEPPRQG